MSSTFLKSDQVVTNNVSGWAGWPVWPVCDSETLTAARQVLESGRWALSGAVVDGAPRERTFASKWAEFIGSTYCTPTNTGTAALTIALEALGIGCRDEVLVPGLTWVACATAVANVNAVPVLVDVDPETLCIDPEAAARMLTPRTRAIMAVHLYGSMADLDALALLAREHGLMLLEDASHVHGAAWRGRRAGSHGLCGTFSMQQTKLLTAGEGGAVTTDNREVSERLEQLRADSRRYRSGAVQAGESELEPGRLIHGSNYCLSELHAAVLLAQLRSLPEQNRRRAANAQMLDEALIEIRGIKPQIVPRAVSERALYHYAFRFDPAHFGQRTASELSKVLSAELEFPVECIYPALHRTPLWLAQNKARHQIDEHYSRSLSFSNSMLPVCDAAPMQWLSLHHRFLLADGMDVLRLAGALRHIQRS